MSRFVFDDIKFSVFKGKHVKKYSSDNVGYILLHHLQ